MKRLLSLILCLMMLVSLMPNAAFADDTAAGAETALTEEVPADEEPADGEEPVDEETPAEEEPAEETPADEEVPAEETPADEEPAEDDIEAESEEDIEALATTASGTCGSKLSWSLSGSGVLTVSGTGAMTDWDSDSSTPPWYPYSDSIKSVVISSGVTSIGNEAFSFCHNLTDVSLPSGVKSIGYAAFEYCSSLTGITLPSSVTSVGMWAFFDCSSLASVSFGSGVTSIGYSAFSSCSSLTSVTIPSSVTSIDNWAFQESALTTIRFEGNAPTIGSNSFAYLTATAYYPSGNSTWTNSVKQDYGGTLTWKAYTPTLDAPVITGAYNYADYVKVVWNAVEGAAKYRLLYRKGTGDWVTYSNTSATRVNISGLEDGASYTFMVACVSADGKTLTSDYSNRASQIRLLSPTVTVSRFGTSGKIDGSGFKVSWNATTGGSRYKVYYREKGGSWALYANYAKSNNTRYVNIKSSQTNASTTAGKSFPDLLIGHTYEFAVLTATSQASITSGFPTTYTGYKF